MIIFSFFLSLFGWIFCVKWYCPDQVVGFESAWDMAKGQMGMGHALRVCQCSEAVIVTKKPLPIQVIIVSFFFDLRSQSMC